MNPGNLSFIHVDEAGKYHHRSSIALDSTLKQFSLFSNNAASLSKKAISGIGRNVVEKVSRQVSQGL
jgi:hypothetical protein